MAGEFVSYDGKPLPKQDPPPCWRRPRDTTNRIARTRLDRLEKRLSELKTIYSEDVPRMENMVALLKELEPTATRRQKASFALMTRFITDTRHLLDEIGLHPEQIDQRLADIATARTARQ